MNDDELDRRLHEYGARWRTQQAPPPEPLLRTHHVPRWVPVAAAAAAVVLIAVGVAVAVNRPHNTAAPIQPGPTPSPTPSGVDLTGTVPWVDRPAPGYTPPATVSPTPPASDARACTSSDVTLSSGGLDGATGHLAHYILFKNVSASTCVLKGYPDVVATEPGQPDFVVRHGSWFPDSSTQNLAPGESANLALETQSICTADPGGGGSGPTYHHVEITFPGGGRKSFASGPLDAKCGIAETQFYVEGAGSSPDVHDPLSDLKLSLELPAYAEPGKPLWYVVDVTNPLSQPISLARCPGYFEHANDDTRTLVKSTYGLNCDDTPAISPGQTVRFAMRLDVPASATGRASVSWQLDLPLAVHASGSVTLD
ncbi:MAG: hypothetical protein QOG53_715 [Frankiales bacterium]|jgi:hypothetical protein|nr:hypothetical protein [Frankiales bacterium]